MARFSLLLFLLIFAWGCDNNPQVEEGFIQSLGDSIYYKTVGVGEPLLIVHGGPVLDHQYLYEHLLPLADTHQLIFYDQRACGRSQVEIDPSRMTFDAMSADIDQIREHLGYEKLSILGHSWGGLVAMKYATTHDDDIHKLILSNSMAPTADFWNQENVIIASRYSEEDQEQLDKLSTSGLIRSKDPAPYIDQMMMISFKSQFYDPEKMDGLKLAIADDYHLRSSVFMNIAPEMSNYDLLDSLSSIESEVLIIYGEIEPATGLYLNTFKEAFPSASIETIKKTGHFPFIEQPKAYFEVIKDFLK